MKALKTKKIRTGSSFYDIKYVTDLINDKDGALRGKVWFDEGYIKISKDYPLYTQLQTLIHESMHTIFEEYGIKGGESKVDMFGKILHSFIIDNPKFIKEILEYAEKIRR